MKKASHQGTIACSTHGRCQTAVMCPHLIGSTGIEYYRAGLSGNEPYSEFVWCRRCEKVRSKADGWSPEAVMSTGIKIVCLPCYRDQISKHKLIKTLRED